MKKKCYSNMTRKSRTLLAQAVQHQFYPKKRQPLIERSRGAVENIGHLDSTR